MMLLIQGFGVKGNLSSCRYIVVFQYGSAVLFNIEDHEVESYLEVVRRHASGLLPEMRKDGKFFWRITYFDKSFYLTIYLIESD